MSDFHSLGLFGGSITQLVPFPSLGCEKSAMDGRHSGEHGPWRHEEAGLHHAFSHLLPPLPASLPLHQFRFPEVSQIRSVFHIITTITFQKCNCVYIPPDLIAFLLCVWHSAWAGENQVGRPGSGPSGRWWSGRRFSLGHLLYSIAPLPFSMGHPSAGRPGCYISSLSCGHPANDSSASAGWWDTVVVSGNPWELTRPFRKPT